MREWEPAAAPRPRPLSGGLWTLFSWLRRDEQHASRDSLSSAGSARTAVSFAFLHAPLCRPGPALPPPAPPTDTYKRRVRDRNLRRHHDRDLTLRRKYGLFTEGGYDAFSLQPAYRREGEERERRAASEGSPRRAYVPGKRRAPPPPQPAATGTASLTRRPTRKRPAPQPPATPTTMNQNQPQKEKKINDSTNMNPRSNYDTRPQSTNEYHYILDCKPKKYSKKEEGPKECKPRAEKSFIKQLFENKKRNSAVETTKILPNISELDKQAAEIIQSCKLKPIEQNNNFMKNSASSSNITTWFCTICLRKYDSTIVTCINCLPDKTKVSLNATFGIYDIYTQTGSGSSGAISKHKPYEISGDEKQKLKEMLKEMKNSLPKNLKNGNPICVDEHKNVYNKKQSISAAVEPTTLRIGFDPDKSNEGTQLPSSKQISGAFKVKTTRVIAESRNRPVLETMAESVVVTQPLVLVAPQLNACDKGSNQILNALTTMGLDINKTTSSSIAEFRNSENCKHDKDVMKTKELVHNHTPVKLSSLLNPVYIPKSITSEGMLSNSSDNIKKSQCDPSINTKVVEKDFRIHNNKNNIKQDIATNTEGIKRVLVNNANIGSKTTAPESSGSSSKLSDCNMIRLSASQHSRRRELINQLEQSIAKGDERCAADAAMKLAQLKLSCAVLSFSSQIAGKTSESSKKIVQDVQGPSSSKENVLSSNKFTEEKVNLPSDKDVAVKYDQDCKTADNKAASVSGPSTSSQNVNNDMLIPIEVWVEDREATRGPVRMQVPRWAAVGELRRRAARQLGLAAHLQRWIVGRTLCLDDATPLATLAGPTFAEPFYLCLVESETTGASITQTIAEITSAKCESAKGKPEENEIQPHSNKTGNVYSQLMQLEQHALVANIEPFQCVVCLEECGSGDGAVLRECVHTFCRECLADLVKHCEEPAVACPAMGCLGALQEREIRALVSPEEYEKWLARGLATAESGTRNAFHCRTRDCTGWALCDPGVLKFPCPVCKKTNCVPCKAIHEGETCEQHRKELEKAADTPDTTQTDEGTRALLDTLINKGEALECPECSAIITKKWGCDWVKCSACKTEICWVTRGRRWGPAGRGDTTAGCRCGVEGKRCHPACGYCH